MILPKFDYHAPSSLEEACQILADLKDSARPLAGGTDLLVNMRKGLIAPKHVISLGRIEPLRRIQQSDGHLRLGACVRASELAGSEAIKASVEALWTGAGRLGSPLIRNLATVGGNLVSARPAADLPPPLMAYGAHAVLKKSSGERSVPLKDFFLGPGETVMTPEELLAEIVVEKQPPFSGAAYIKLGARKALVISLVNAAAYLALDEPDGTIQSARVVLGAVAPVPTRSASAEQVLCGERPSDSLFAKAGEAAAGDSRPIDDFRGSADYRKAMVAVLTRRALRAALQNIQEKG